MKNLQKVVLNFKFKKGETKTYVYGRVATMKRDEEMDVAFSLYTLDFKLSPKVIEHTRQKKFLWFTTGTKVWHETVNRNLDLSEKDKLQDHRRRKAITKFRSEYAYLVEAKPTNTSRVEL